jgi:hypothetical protein
MIKWKSKGIYVECKKDILTAKLNFYEFKIYGLWVNENRRDAWTFEEWIDVLEDYQND